MLFRSLTRSTRFPANGWPKDYIYNAGEIDCDSKSFLYPQKDLFENTPLRLFTVTHNLLVQAPYTGARPALAVVDSKETTSYCQGLQPT